MLYVVATPIGNLEDITLRALRILREADFIICEDTRVTGRLLARYQIEKSLVSCHQHTENTKIVQLVKRLLAGQTAALVTDAGTPGVNDPGNKVVALAIRAGIDIVPIPGPSALTAILSVAGVPTDRFWFVGFIPHKKGRQILLERIAATPEAVVFYESSHRIRKTLEQLQVYIGERPVVVGRELTKVFETIYRGSIPSFLPTLIEKGEFVISVTPT